MAFPLLFASQQAAEGVLWLSLPGPGNSVLVTILANFFTIIALVVWPVLVPVAIGLAEELPGPRRVLLSLAPIGLVAALYSIWAIWSHPYDVSLEANRICYSNHVEFPPAVSLLYLLAVSAPIFSSHLVLRLFAAVTALGLLVSAFFYFFAFISVWCFFAALASIVIAAFALTDRRDRFPARLPAAWRPAG